MTTENDIFSVWQPWQVALAETVAAEMIRHGLTPEEMRDLARAYMLNMVEIEAQRAAAVPGAAPPGMAEGNRARRHAGRGLPKVRRPVGGQAHVPAGESPHPHPARLQQRRVRLGGGV